MLDVYRVGRGGSSVRRTQRLSVGMPVLVADPDPLALAALSSSLRGAFGPSTEARSVEEALAAAEESEFGVAIVSEWFPGARSGVELARELHRAQPSALIIMIAIPGREHEVLPAIRAGARGYLLKESDMHHLPDAVDRALRQGTGEFSSPLTDELLAELIDRDPKFERMELTQREHEVVELVRRGLSNRAIADALRISVATVKTHVHSAMRKSGVENRVQLALEREKAAKRRRRGPRSRGQAGKQGRAD